MKIIAIDPGISGAIAVVEQGANNGWSAQVWDMPVRTVSTARRRNKKGLMQNYEKKGVDARELQHVLREAENAFGTQLSAVLVERVGGIFRQDKAQKSPQPISSTFRFGEGAGVVRATVELTLPVEITMVQPTVWKRACGLIGKEKDASRLLVLDMVTKRYLPKILEAELRRKKDVDRADALLLALHQHLDQTKKG